MRLLTGQRLLGEVLVGSMAVSSVCVRCWRCFGPGIRPLTVKVQGRVHRTRPTTAVRQMSLFPNLPDSISALTNRRREFSEERVLGYSPEMVYEVVADLNSYYQFLPWCKESQYIQESPEKSIAKLSVGFPPLTENYTAMVLYNYPHSIRTISTDGNLFSHLENHWQFKRGPDLDSGPTCLVGFWVMFEFRSLLYTQLGNIVFDEVARKMAQAFEKRCETVYGPSHLSPQNRRMLRTKLRPVRTPHY